MPKQKEYYVITDVTGKETQKRLDHYNKWLRDPNRDFVSVYPGYPGDKKTKSRKKGKMMEAAVDTSNVAYERVAKVQKPAKAARSGTKLSKATEIVQATGKDDKEACLKAIVEALAVTRGNASIYYAKALAILG